MIPPAAVLAAVHQIEDPAMVTVPEAPPPAVAGGSSLMSPTMVTPAPSLPPIPKKLADSMIAGNFVDFAELPPAKGRSKMRPTVEGQVVLVQAAELFQARRLIADFTTWSQCFAIFAAVITMEFPDRTPSLMAYMASIAKASARYRWPSWVIYDLNFRQHAAGTGMVDWSKVDPGLYSECFNGMAKSEEGWCVHCYSTDHASEHCMHRPLTGKRSSAAQLPAPKRQAPGSNPLGTTPICRKYMAIVVLATRAGICMLASSAASWGIPSQGA